MQQVKIKTGVLITAVVAMAIMGPAVLAQSGPTQAELDAMAKVIATQFTAAQRSELKGIATNQGKSPEALLWRAIDQAKREGSPAKADAGPARRGIASQSGGEDPSIVARAKISLGIPGLGNEDPPTPKK